VLLKSAEVRVDRLDDVERRILVDRDVGRETLDDPSLVSQSGRGEGEGKQRRGEGDRQDSGRGVC
jgi:hypothetical protein